MGFFDFFQKKPSSTPQPWTPAEHIGRWVILEVSGLPPPHTRVCGFVYVDPDAGLSVRGGPDGDASVAERPEMTLRMPMGLLVASLTAEEAAAKKLPATPSWLTHYGPQPARDALWRSDPGLRGKMHPGFPDDVQVIVHDGEPRRTGKQAEQCWVRITGHRPTAPRGYIYDAKASGLSRVAFEARHAGHPVVYEGTLLNQPHQLTTVRQNDTLLFYGNVGQGAPLHVTAAYVAERAGWDVQPCDKCGFAEGLDPPTTMAKTRFPDAPADASVEQFTSKCPMCGGMQMFIHRTEKMAS